LTRTGEIWSAGQKWESTETESVSRFDSHQKQHLRFVGFCLPLATSSGRSQLKEWFAYNHVCAQICYIVHGVNDFVKKYSIADRLEEYRLSLGLTWRQVAERLRLSVPMVMQVRSGLRKMGPLALRRFEEAEQAAKAEILACKVVEGLLDDYGTARELIERVSRESGPVTFPLRYRAVSGIESLPTDVVLNGPNESARERILTLFRRTLDPRIVILACADDCRFDEAFLAKITPACLQDLQQAAMILFFGPRWRSVVVKMALADAGS
jgi:transcriptional regulator with XRE-family HTH domain